MSDFVVSARKYRPNNFEDVVGQLAIAEALQNAVDSEKLSHSLLFHGPRGVGKTTCARILAKKINQQYAPDSDDFSFNVFELDAASNNKVDDIRNLIDQVRFLPQVGKYKVYIIDEVHMLSNQAFNAFLKTLEEPPAHAIFILATTEKHKIPATVLSRCQIYDFQRISTKDIHSHLEKIAKLESVSYEEEALHLIAQNADGGLRDSLSSFDKLVTFTNANLSLELVSKHLNVLGYEQYILLTKEILSSNLNAALVRLDTIVSKGFNLHLFIGGLAMHFRNLWMSKVPETTSLLDVVDATKEKYTKLSKECSLDFLKEALSICNDLDLNYKSMQNPRLGVELGLMKIASIGKEDIKKKVVT